MLAPCAGAEDPVITNTKLDPAVLVNCGNNAEEPYDQIIGIMLLVKLNAITEGRLLIHDIQITSKMSDGVSCLHSIEENTGPFGTKGWWRENNLKITNKMIKSKKKIVKLTKTVSNWDEISLNWKDKKVTSDASEILYASFEKTDK